MKKVNRKYSFKKMFMLFLVLLLACGQWTIATSSVQASSSVATGASYFTDTDNWGGGAGNSTADGDLDVGLKNQNKTGADNYDKYPLEFKITNVDKLPTTSAQLLIRAYDVDEYIEAVTDPGNGEWDRVYFSSNAADIALGASETVWPTSTTWTNNINSAGIPSQGYKKEIPSSNLLGALSGKDSAWNTTVLTFKPHEFNRISLGDNYVGITIHHYYQDTRTTSFLANTNWQMTVDWGQLIIDGGSREKGEITSVGLKVETGKVTIDTSFLSHIENQDFSMEVNLIEQTLVNGQIVERNVGLDSKLFQNIANNEEVDWNNIVITDPTINSGNEYTVNIILFEDRGDGIGINPVSPGKAHHVITYSTNDPVAADISKSALRSDSTFFTAADFKDKYLKISGLTPIGEDLQSVKIVTLPDSSIGELRLSGLPVTAGQIIPIADINGLSFIPVAPGFDGTVSFLWNGFNGTKYGQEDAVVTINSSPEVSDFKVFMKLGEPAYYFSVEDDFKQHFIDPGNEALVSIKIVTLPDSAKGKLVLEDGLGGEADVASSDEILIDDVARLKFVPTAEFTGDVTFDWNGSDGIQFALHEKTVTLSVNTPPVVAEIEKSGRLNTNVSFSENDFTRVSSYSDVNLDELKEVKLVVPSNFAASGTLYYEPQSGAVALTPGSTVTLTVAELSTLYFEPSNSLEEFSEVVFHWYGSDGMHFSENIADITISFNGKPIADELVIYKNEGDTPIVIDLSGTFNGSVIESVYGAIVTGPSKGELDQNNSNGSSWIYTPDSTFKSGKDSFTYTVTVDNETSLEANVTIHIQKLLEGWVGDKQQGDTTVVNALPDELLKLSAISSHLAEEVIATINGDEVNLVLSNPLTWLTDGYKTWKNTSYVLPNGTLASEYSASFIAKDAGGTELQTEASNKLEDNKFQVRGATLTLTANPNRILGDGKSTTELVAKLQDEDGNPISGVEVVFTAPPLTGQILGSNKATTNAQGIAKVTYQSAQISGVTEQQITIQAEVDDVARGLRAQGNVDITFMPASIQGIITKSGTNTPVAGASVRVTLDINLDGVITPGIDFDETVITDENGTYKVIVPKGDTSYNLEVKQLLSLDGMNTEITYNQSAKVGIVQGTGDENFDSEKTIAGIILFKKPNGQASLLSNDLLTNSAIYLKDSMGNYLTEGGVPKAYSLNNLGVFHAEGLAVGTYTLEVHYKFEPNKSIIISRSNVSVNASGEMNILEELVDPYGTITDAVTHLPIEGAKVVLYYASTQRNINKGLIPKTEVFLPTLVGFDPNDNKSPDQLSDHTGFYAYMVYPETDYYLVVTKDGYNSYTSPVLSVEWDIVRHDLELSPFKNFYFAPQPVLSLNLSVSQNKAQEGTTSSITISYKNETGISLPTGQIKLTLPKGVEVIDAAGGTIKGDDIIWTVNDVLSLEERNFKFTVKWPNIEAVEKVFELVGTFTVVDSSVKSKVLINVFKQGEVSHYRYILGYPDGEFKPNKSITRAEIAAIVARLTENETIDYTLPYTDIRNGHWATNYIRIATKHAYFTSTYDNKLFRPDEAITRGELASVMARFLKLEVSKPTVSHFSDTAGHWAGNTIETLYNGNYLVGYSDRTFKPDNLINRVEAVTMINRMLYRGPLKGKPVLFPDVPVSHWGFADVQEATFSHIAVRNPDGSETWLMDLADNMQ